MGPHGPKVVCVSIAQNYTYAQISIYLNRVLILSRVFNGLAGLPLLFLAERRRIFAHVAWRKFLLRPYIVAMSSKQMK